MNAEKLTERIKQSFNAPSGKDEKVKVVLICIVISTTFWFFNALNQENYSLQIEYPIEWNFDQEQLIAVGELPNNIALEVNGGGWDLMARSFGFNMSPLTIDLANANGSNYILTADLRADLSRNLDPVGINYLITDSLLFNVQPRIKRQLKLTFDDAELQFDSDYRLSGNYVLQPDSIEVVGPEEMINALPDSLVVIHPRNGIDRDFEEDISLPELPDQVISMQEKVTLSFDVIRLISINEEKRIELINFPEGWEAETDMVAIDYRISESQFDVTDSIRVKIVADYVQWNEQDSTVILEVVQVLKTIDQITLSTDKIKVYQQ